MSPSFNLDHSALKEDARFTALGRMLDESFPAIDSRESFNRYCRRACEGWREVFPDGIGTTKEFKALLRQIDDRQGPVIATSWGGVVITAHAHPRVEKYLVIRHGGYLALEKHEQKDERVEVREGAGLLLWRQSKEQALSVQPLAPGAAFHFSPNREHCLIGTEDLLIFERSTDPKGMDQDLIFLFEPDVAAPTLHSSRDKPRASA